MATKRTAVKKTPAKKKAPARRPATSGRSGGGGAPGGVFDWSKRLQGEEYLTPMLLFVIALPVFAGLIRVGVARAESRLVLAGVTALVVSSGAALTWVIWAEAAPRRAYPRARSAISVAWMHASVVMALLWPGWAPLWVIAAVGFELGLWWAVAALPAVRGDGNDDHGSGKDDLAEALGLSGTTVRKVEDDDTGVRRTIGLKLRDVSHDALVGAMDLIATKAGVPRNGVRIVEDPDNASTPSLVLVRKDVLRRMPPWPGPSRPGASIMEPVRCGLREDGTDLEAVRPGRHALVGGTTGAGKTEGAVTEAADIWTRCDVVSFWSDTVKPGQTIPDIAPALARIATTRPGTKKLVVGLRAAIEYRAGIVKGRNWKPTRALPAVHVHFEEGALVLELLGNDFTKLVQTARSVGIFVTISLQRPSATVLDTDARAQLADTWCFGVLRDEDAAMVLTDGVIERGARPEVWGDKRPGYCYREAGPEEKHPMPARTWEIPVPRLRAHIAEWAPRMTVLDTGTAKAMGGAWTELTSGADYALAHGWHRSDTGAWTPPALDDTDEENDMPTDDTGPPVPDTAPLDTGDTTDPDDNEEEVAAEMADIRRQADEDYPPDPEIVGALIEAAQLGEDEDPPEVPLDGDLWTGEPGPTLDRRGRVLAFATVIGDLLLDAAPQPEGGAILPTDDLVAKLMEVPGWGSGQRPAMYRLIDHLEAAGEAEDRDRGSWWFASTAPGWLRRELANSTDSDDEDAYEDVNA